ncbi:MAG TPA: L,D-transpeptidase family protein [Gemmatimonadaceae bacterium]|jgi:D-alanyl-D-alanine dipeptidase
MPSFRFVILAISTIAIAACQSPRIATAPSPISSHEAGPTSRSLQMIVVVTDDWTSVPGVMRRYVRDGVRSSWRQVGPEVPVVVGSAGLGWGDGMHGVGSPGEPGPIKHEGDQRSPAGVFRLTSAFGYVPKDSVSWIKLPYTQATDAYKCVDDAASVHYNQMLLAARGSAIDWHSAEDMHRRDSLYSLGVVVEHNANGREVGGGSCIFLHIWPGPDGSTVGCTAFRSDVMREMLAWLDPDALPILVQLPRSAYDRLRGTWALP